MPHAAGTPFAALAPPPCIRRHCPFGANANGRLREFPQRRREALVELYDHGADPEEIHDVSTDPANVKAMLELENLIAQKVGPLRPAENFPDSPDTAPKTKNRKA